MNIRKIRKAQKITMKQLGQMVGVTESAIGMYETGKRKPDYEMLLKISEALNCTVNDLLTDVDSNKDRLNRALSDENDAYSELQSMMDDENFRNLMDGYKKMRSNPDKVRTMKSFMSFLNEEGNQFAD